MLSVSEASNLGHQLNEKRKEARLGQERKFGGQERKFEDGLGKG
jgi:hypothetical protein